MENNPRIIWTYSFDESSIEHVLADVLTLDNWEIELPDSVIESIREAFAQKIIWKLPNGFCIRRVHEFENEVELYTFY